MIILKSCIKYSVLTKSNTFSFKFTSIILNHDSIWNAIILCCRKSTILLVPSDITIASITDKAIIVVDINYKYNSWNSTTRTAMFFITYISGYNLSEEQKTSFRHRLSRGHPHTMGVINIRKWLESNFFINLITPSL